VSITAYIFFEVVFPWFCNRTSTYTFMVV